MKKAEELATQAVNSSKNTAYGPDTELSIATRAVNLALEWAAQQCEANDHEWSQHENCHPADAKSIRAGTQEKQ